MTTLLVHAWHSVPGGVRPICLKDHGYEDSAILHSRAVDVIAFADSEELAHNFAATLVNVRINHRWAVPEPLESILKACEIGEGTHDDGKE
jgi:hypothetical protein